MPKKPKDPLVPVEFAYDPRNAPANWTSPQPRLRSAIRRIAQNQKSFFARLREERNKRPDLESFDVTEPVTEFLAGKDSRSMDPGWYDATHALATKIFEKIPVALVRFFTTERTLKKILRAYLSQFKISQAQRDWLTWWYASLKYGKDRTNGRYG